MIRPARLFALSVVPLAMAAVALLAALAAPVGPDAAVAAVPHMTTPAPSPSCTGCVSPQDAVCWEDTVCPIPVTMAIAVPHTITVHYRTVAMTAKPSIDYIPVPDAVLTIQPGQTIAYVHIQLLPDPGMIQPKQFAVAFYDIIGGQLTRSQAIVTITPPGPPN